MSVCGIVPGRRCRSALYAGPTCLEAGAKVGKLRGQARVAVMAWLHNRLPCQEGRGTVGCALHSVFNFTIYFQSP